MPWVPLIVVLFLLVLNAFFAMSELAVVSSRRARLHQMMVEGRRGAASALRLVDDPTGFLSSVQIGITLVAILSGAYGESSFAQPLAEELGQFPAIASHASAISSAVVVSVLAYVSLIVGELVPKRLALTNPERFACIVAGPMTVLAAVCKPIVLLLRVSTEAVLRLIGVRPDSASRVTEEEVKSLIAEGTEAGVFQPAEREMLEGVLRVADRSVRSIMVARPDVVWLDINDGPDAVMNEISASGHSRYPIARGDIEDLIGVVHAKDLLEQQRSTGTFDLEAVARPAVFVADRTPILKLLDQFRSANVHLIVVVDEHGSIEGIVTPSDILSAIAGSLPEGEGEPDPDAVRRHDGSWLLDGRMPIDDVERTLGLKGMNEDEEFSTIAGFVLNEMRRIPAAGESFVWKGWRFEVVDLDNRRIDKVLASLVSDES